MTRKYDSVIVLKTEGNEEGVDHLINELEKEFESEGAKLQQIDRLGRKEFVYTPRKLNSGFYVNYFFEAEPAALKRIQDRLKTNANVFLQHHQLQAK